MTELDTNSTEAMIEYLAEILNPEISPNFVWPQGNNRLIFVDVENSRFWVIDVHEARVTQK